MELIPRGGGGELCLHNVEVGAVTEQPLAMGEPIDPRRESSLVTRIID